MEFKQDLESVEKEYEEARNHIAELEQYISSKDSGYSELAPVEKDLITATRFALGTYSSVLGIRLGLIKGRMKGEKATPPNDGRTEEERKLIEFADQNDFRRESNGGKTEVIASLVDGTGSYLLSLDPGYNQWFYGKDGSRVLYTKRVSTGPEDIGNTVIEMETRNRNDGVLGNTFVIYFTDSNGNPDKETRQYVTLSKLRTVKPFFAAKEA